MHLRNILGSHDEVSTNDDMGAYGVIYVMALYMWGGHNVGARWRKAPTFMSNILV